jgi:hypothetical protein
VRRFEVQCAQVCVQVCGAVCVCRFVVQCVGMHCIGVGGQGWGSVTVDGTAKEAQVGTASATFFKQGPVQLWGFKNPTLSSLVSL